MITDSREVINEGGSWGGGYGGGGIGLFLLAIFLIVLFSLFRRGNDGWGEGHGYNHGGYGYGVHGCGGVGVGTISMVSAEMAELSKDQALDTGRIIHAIDNQTCDLERMNLQNIIDEQRERAICAEQKYLHQESLWAAKLYQQETANLINQQACIVNNRLTRIEDEMLKAPPVYGYAAVSALQPCGAVPFGGNCCG